MPKPVKISEAGGTLSPPAPSAFEHAKPDAVVAGLPNLRLEELRLQWRNHLARFIHSPDPSEILNTTNLAIYPDFGGFSTRRSSSSFAREFD